MKICLPLICVPGLALIARAEPSFELFSYTGKDLFPSAIISTATVDWSEFDEAETEGTDEEEPADKEDSKDAADEESDAVAAPLGDPNGWLGVLLSDVPNGADLKVELSGDGWLKPSVFTGKAVDSEGHPLEGEIDVMPKNVWDYDALRNFHEQKPENLTIKVSINGKELPSKTETVVVRSMNDCPFFVTNGDGDEDIEDISWCFAAYVNENHPWIDGILKSALETAKSDDGKPLIEAFTGYQSEDEEEVVKQVFAIWQVLQRRGIRYSDVSTTVPSKTVISQVVRFVDESVEASQANCVDGSVLMASILTKIGLNAYLVMIPGHCFLAFDADKDGETVVGLETTMLGNDHLKSLDDLKALQKKAFEDKIDIKQLEGDVAKEAEASMKTFLNAMETGNENLEKHAEAFASGDDPKIQLISIAEWRKHGIMPLASGKERK